MIEKYASKLIENLPNNITSSQTNINLILDGGLFNGSYLIGAMYFIKEMEKKNYIIIHNISACSVGSIIALLYYNNSLELITPLYKLIKQNLENTYSLSLLKSLKLLLKQHINENILNKINNKLFISYYNIKRNKKIIKYNYKNYDELINTIIKSCFIPFFIDGNLLFKKKYMDGLNPYIFKKQKNIKILYLDLYGYDKLTHFLIIKNENNNYHRILSGLLDIHSFFIKNTNTYMCSYFDDWNIINNFNFSLKLSIEKLVLYTVIIIYNFNKKYNINLLLNNTGIFGKIIKTIYYDIFIILFDYYII